MNRAEKRNYFRQQKRNFDAIYCPKCKHKTRHMALPHEDTCDIYCEVCFNKLATGIKPGTRGVYPREWVKGRYFYPVNVMN